jgi:UDP-N-acetylglucosamine:LPS N-acetylglucosamine transferase
MERVPDVMWSTVTARLLAQPALAPDFVIDLDGPRDTSVPRQTTAPSQVRTRPRVMFVASNGGHLAQLLGLRSWWAGRERVWVSFDKADARSQLEGEEVIWAHWPTTRNLPNLARNFWLALRVLGRDRPDVLVSTGAGVALPFFIAARLRRIPTVFIEVYDRMDSRSLSGRLCRPFATEFLVQWPEQEKFYPGSTMVGPLM